VAGFIWFHVAIEQMSGHDQFWTNLILTAVFAHFWIPAYSIEQGFSIFLCRVILIFTK